MTKHHRPIMKAVKTPDSKFNKHWLEVGTKIELEHTNSKQVAKNIAKQHLLESPQYYKYLIPMERKLKRIGGKQ